MISGSCWSLFSEYSSFKIFFKNSPSTVWSPIEKQSCLLPFVQCFPWHPWFCPFLQLLKSKIHPGFVALFTCSETVIGSCVLTYHIVTTFTRFSRVSSLAPFSFPTARQHISFVLGWWVHLTHPYQPADLRAYIPSRLVSLHPPFCLPSYS